MNIFHYLFDKLYPLIRFIYERLQGHRWFDQIDDQLWLGGAPTYKRDYAFILENKIDAVVNVRAERQNDLDFFDQHGIVHLQLKVYDVMLPDYALLDLGANWIDEQVQKGRTVLVHCAKGRGRSTTLLAAYLMKYRGMSYMQAKAMMFSKRPLTKLTVRNERHLLNWMAHRPDQISPATSPADPLT